MGTKQQTAFCSTCGRNTNHVTGYQRNDAGDLLVTDIRCPEHKNGRIMQRYLPAVTTQQAGLASQAGNPFSPVASAFIESRAIVSRGRSQADRKIA